MTVERADDDKCRVGLPLKIFKLANNVINGLIGRKIGRFDRHNLKIVKDKNRSCIFAKWTKLKNEVVDVVFLKFEDVEVKVGRFKIGNNIGESRKTAENVKTGRKNLKLVDIRKTSFAVRKKLHRINVFLKF